MDAALLLASIVQTTLIVLIGIAVLFWFWPVARLDSFRQNLFVVRDELFDYAASGKISFQHPAYRLLRQTANGFIRHAHRITVFQIVMTLVIGKITGSQPKYNLTKQWEDALDSVGDSQVKKDLKVFHSRLIWSVAERIVLGSPIMIAILIVVLVVHLCGQGWKSISDAFHGAVIDAASRVGDPRALEEQAMRAAAW